ncbi:type 4a pilus biogenesis protein PilO [Candidatus Nomurabacteria bacterium]|nr:type 4a pilus biogenesis protein PilO [Candidatus Nomurabacteria bacterium]
MSPQTEKPVSKREKISKANSTVFVAVALAAVIAMFCIISIKFLWTRRGYNARVISAKSQARDQLETNNKNLDTLLEQFEALDKSATTNSKTILHALPPVYDYPALATYMESLAQQSGVTLPGSVGQDISAGAVSSSIVSSPLEIPLNIEVNGSYDSVVQFIKNTEFSIRPIHITGIEYTGTNDQIKAVITANTYYQPARDLGVGKKEIQ